MTMIYRSLLLLMACGMLAACNGNYSAPSGSAKVNLVIEARKSVSSTHGAMKAAPLVESLVITVSGPDMTTITSALKVTAGEIVTETFSVPTGNNRVFSAVFLDASNNPAYGGSVIVLSLSAAPITVDITVGPLFFTGTRLIGTANDEYGYAIARDTGGNLYVAGLTYGLFSAPLNTSPTNTPEVFITKTDISGEPLWTRQFGSGGFDLPTGIAVDGSGNIIITGATGSNLFGQANNGNADCFVTKLNSAGATVWTKLIGGAGDDMCNAVAVDASGNVYVTGFIDSAPTATVNDDVFVAKFDSVGTQKWLTQYGSLDTDMGQGIAVDNNGNCYVTGFTLGSFPTFTNAGSSDIFVSKLDSAGNETTIQRGGADSEQATSIAVDNAAGIVYVAGSTFGSMGLPVNPDTSGNSSDIFVASFSLSLVDKTVWQAGTIGSDTAQGIAVDSNGDVIVVGSTNGTFAGNINAGGYDSVVIKFLSLNGTVAWVNQIGTINDDDGTCIVADNIGNVIVTGTEKGDFDGIANSGFGSDAFLMSYDTDGVKW